MPGDRFPPTATPQVIDGVEIAVFEGEAVLFDEAAAMLHRLNAVAGAVWMCCDGQTTVDSMSDELADVFGTPRSEIAPIILEALERFAEEGLLVGHPGPARMSLEEPASHADDGTEILAVPPDP